MPILAIESSCDETAAAIVESGRHVRSSVIASQIELHAPFGGVIPEIAARGHLRMIDSLVDRAMVEAGVEFDQIEAIAVTQGPGLVGALLVGISYAKALSLSTGLPLIPVNHVHAHVHGALLGVDEAIDLESLFPLLALVVSGGHTHLYRMETPTEFHLLGYSVDDACGEAFDKVAKLLGLGYPGGPQIEKAAQSGDPNGFPMPQVGRKDDFCFSYSGLKTHLSVMLRKEGWDQKIPDICASFQREALGQLLRKIGLAKERYPSMENLLIAGGVSANQEFRRRLGEIWPGTVHWPPLPYCSDNAAMIAALAYHLHQKGGVFPTAQWDAFPRYDYGVS